MCFGLSHNLSSINLIYHLYIYVPIQFTYVFSKLICLLCIYLYIYICIVHLSIYLVHICIGKDKDYDLTEHSETLRFLTFLGSDIQQHSITKTFRFAIQ